MIAFHIVHLFYRYKHSFSLQYTPHIIFTYNETVSIDISICLYAYHIGYTFFVSYDKYYLLPNIFYEEIDLKGCVKDIYTHTFLDMFLGSTCLLVKHNFSSASSANLGSVMLRSILKV